MVVISKMPRILNESMQNPFMAVVLIAILLPVAATTAMTIPHAYALYVADSQTVTTAMNTPVTFHLTGSAPEDFFYRVLTHPDVADTCTEGYVPDPPSCDHGYMEYNGMTGQVWYVPNTDFVGTDSFTFETAAEMGPWHGDVIGVVTIIVTEIEEAMEMVAAGSEADDDTTIPVTASPPYLANLSALALAVIAVSAGIGIALMSKRRNKQF